MSRTTLIFLGFIWLFIAIGFGYFGLTGFISDAANKGFRATLCGSDGCTDREYLLSVLWLAGVILVLYILPIVLLAYFVQKKRR